jgi:hypothetical protein
MDIEPKMAEHPEDLYKTQWKAFFKPGLGSPTIVYGESEDEAKKNALAYFRKNNGSLENWPAERIVEKVEFIG